MNQLLRTKSIDKLIADSEEPEHRLRKSLGPWSLTALGIGAVIGSGIFTLTGTAAAGENVSVAIAGHTAKAKADGQGAWRVKLPKMNYGGPFTLTVTAASGTKTFSDVMVGEVWVASGQSNM